jgi:hypothetical protein
MNLLYAAFFGAGVAAYVYSTFARRVGYSNKQNVFILLYDLSICYPCLNSLLVLVNVGFHLFY